LEQWREGRLALSRGQMWEKRAARFLALSPELVPLLTGLVVNRIGNLQEGLFAGCIVAGIGMALRRDEANRVLIAGAAALIFIVCVVIGGMVPSNQALPAGVVASLAGITAAGIVLALGLGELDPARIVGWSPKKLAIDCLWIGGVAMALSVVAALGIGRLNEIDPAWGNAAVTIERAVGRVASWLIAIPLGLAVGALFGRVNRLLDQLGREPISAFAIGAALLAIVAAWSLRELQPSGVTQAARFAAFSGGPALSVAESQLARWPHAAIEAQLAAAGGVFWLKMLLLAVPMLVGGAAVGAVVRLSAGEKR
jgi:hypothetical protein